MCCFSRPVKHVSATQIFARHVDGGRQALAYSMNLDIEEELAMVLPIPVMPGSGESAVAFVDLSAYPKLFIDLANAFPPPPSFGQSRGGPQPAARSLSPTLVVHDVGDFVASFVPTPRDFDRLDPRFRLSPTVFESRAEYDDYGFAVFQLKPKKRGFFRRSTSQTIHPMAFTFPSRRPRAFFYPTLHVHDGSVPERATFDHALYCQTNDELLARTMPFHQSDGPLGKHVNVANTAGLVDPTQLGYRNSVMFEQRNVDFWYEPPACAGAHVLAGEGDFYAFKLSATAAYYMEFGYGPARRWHEAARTKLDAVHAALTEGCRALTSENASEWHLVKLHPDQEKGWLSNDTVFGPSADSRDLGGSAAMKPGTERTLRVSVTTDGEAIEPQRVDLAFSRVPSPSVVAEIRRKLNVIVSRAVS